MQFSRNVYLKNHEDKHTARRVSPIQNKLCKNLTLTFRLSSYVNLVLGFLMAFHTVTGLACITPFPRQLGYKIIFSQHCQQKKVNLSMGLKENIKLFIFNKGNLHKGWYTKILHNVNLNIHLQFTLLLVLKMICKCTVLFRSLQFK